MYTGYEATITYLSTAPSPYVESDCCDKLRASPSLPPAPPASSLDNPRAVCPTDRHNPCLVPLDVSRMTLSAPQMIITRTCSYAPGQLCTCFVQLDVSTIECVINPSSEEQPIDWSMLHVTSRLKDPEIIKSGLSDSI